MIHWAISGVLVASGLATASQRHINARDVCSSSPSRLAHCQQPILGHWDDSFVTQVPLRNLADAPPLPSSPWNSPHECITANTTTDESPFCVHSSHTFSNGRGISILTTPERIDAIQSFPAFVEAGALSGVNEPWSPPYEELELPGRGRGLIANKTLHRGDRIFAHTPVLILDAEMFEDLDEEQWVKLEHAAVAGLPARTRGLFGELYGQPTVDPVSDRIDTNAFEIEIDDDTHYAVFPEIARLNHDCRPNAAYFFDPETLTQYVHAIATITPGTEITITYVDPHMMRRERLRQLSTSWGFNCSCSLCSLHPTLTKASDARLAQMTTLTERLEKWQTASSKIAEALISLYEQERLHAPMSSAYRFAALTSCAEGNRWNTIKYARLAVEFKMLDDGFRDKDVRLMQRLAQKPEEQKCWSIQLK